jgi:hypothetical protein
MAEEIMIYFTKSKDYKIFAATGAWGGVSPNGEVTVDFFIEKKDPPKELTLILDKGETTEKGRLGEKIIREAQVGFVLRPDIAYSIGDWLMRTAEKAGFKPKKEVEERSKHVH